eukprot:442496-Prorocentrum_lima.AAC.1
MGARCPCQAAVPARQPHPSRRRSPRHWWMEAVPPRTSGRASSCAHGSCATTRQHKGSGRATTQVRRGRGRGNVAVRT